MKATKSAGYVVDHKITRNVVPYTPVVALRAVEVWDHRGESPSKGVSDLIVVGCVAITKDWYQGVFPDDGIGGYKYETPPSPDHTGLVAAGYRFCGRHVDHDVVVASAAGFGGVHPYHAYERNDNPRRVFGERVVVGLATWPKEQWDRVIKDVQDDLDYVHRHPNGDEDLDDEDLGGD